MRARSWCAVVAAFCMIAAPMGAHAAGRTVIENVSIVDVVAGAVQPMQTVVVEDGKIAAIVGGNEDVLRAGDTPIDGAGLFLMPGLFDSHVHYVSEETYGPLMLAHGVTFVRDLGGVTEQILNLRDRLNRGEALGPEMIATGAIIDGDPPVWPFSEAVDTPEEARAAVRKLAKRGVDQIKLYSKLDRDSYFAAVDEAKKVGLKPVGHVPTGVTVEEAIAAGQLCIEHLEGFDELISRSAGVDTSKRTIYDRFKYWDAYDKADQEKLHAVYKQLADAGVAQCTTIVVMKCIGGSPEHDENDPRLQSVPPYLRQFWSGEGYGKMSAGAKRVVPTMQKVALELHKAGVPILVGTDLANPFVFAGSSVHEEMALLQDAGIPTADVVRSATITPAAFFGVDDRLGTVEAGKAANLVLVHDNPLADVRNASKIAGVFLRGRYFDRAALDELIAQARKTAQDAKPAETAQVVADALPGEELMRGVFRSKYMQWDAGTESFIVTKDGAGYHIRGHIKPKGGPGQPSIGTFHYDPGFKLQRVVWQELSAAKPTTVYSVEGNEIVARRTVGDADPEEQRVKVEGEWYVSGPFNANEIATNVGLGMKVGESKTIRSVSFGYPSWKMQTGDVEIERHEDEPLEQPNGLKVNSQHYTSSFTTPMGDFYGEMWTDDSGVPLKGTLKMPFGTISYVLDMSPAGGGDANGAKKSTKE